MLYAIVVVLLLIADQGLKYWVTVHVALNEGRHVLIPKVLDVMNIHNYGIAFSWLQNVPSWVFALIAAAFAVVVILALRRGMIHGAFGRWMAVLALAGAIGNCIDRVLSGYVVDMLAFAFWKSFPVFNLADACLVVGGIAFCLYVIFHKDPEADAGSQGEEAARKRAARGDQKPRARSPRWAGKKRCAAKTSRPQQKGRSRRAQKRARSRQPQPPCRRRSAKANDDPFAAWDRAVSEQDARDKAAQERKAAREAAYRAARRRGKAGGRREAEGRRRARMQPSRPPRRSPPWTTRRRARSPRRRSRRWPPSSRRKSRRARRSPPRRRAPRNRSAMIWRTSSASSRISDPWRSL